MKLTKEQQELALKISAEKILGAEEEEIAFDFLMAFLAELAKGSEPVAWVGEGLKLKFPEELENMRKYDPGMATLYDTPLFLHPLPQADLVAEIERLTAEKDCWKEQSEMLQHQNDEAYAELRGEISRLEEEIERLKAAIAEIRSDLIHMRCPEFSEGIADGYERKFDDHLKAVIAKANEVLK